MTIAIELDALAYAGAWVVTLMLVWAGGWVVVLVLASVWGQRKTSRKETP